MLTPCISIERMEKEGRNRGKKEYRKGEKEGGRREEER
jgi:hypothetical protein